MTKLLILAGIVIVLVAALAVARAIFEGGTDDEKKKYRYRLTDYGSKIKYFLKK